MTSLSYVVFQRSGATYLEYKYSNAFKKYYCKWAYVNREVCLSRRFEDWRGPDSVHMDWASEDWSLRRLKASDRLPPLSLPAARGQLFHENSESFHGHWKNWKIKCSLYLIRKQIAWVWYVFAKLKVYTVLDVAVL